MIRKIYIRILCRLNKAIDIHSRGKYPSNVLSNFWGNSFSYDGVLCKSMEGFLQALKHPDVEKQRQVCQCKGKKAKNMGTETWKVNQKVYWKGKAIDRHSLDFQDLINGAYKAMFEQSKPFHDALMLSRGKKLYHSLGMSNPYKTILTESELCSILTRLREEEDLQRVCTSICTRKGCPFRKK